MEHILLIPLLLQFRATLVDLVVVLQTKHLEVADHLLEEVEIKYLEELTRLQIKGILEEQEEIKHMVHSIMVPVVVVQETQVIPTLEILKMNLLVELEKEQLLLDQHIA